MDQHGCYENQLALSFPDPTSLHSEMPPAPMRCHGTAALMTCILVGQVILSNPDAVVEGLDALKQSGPFLDPESGDTSHGFIVFAMLDGACQPERHVEEDLDHIAHRCVHGFVEGLYRPSLRRVENPVEPFAQGLVVPLGFPQQGDLTAKAVLALADENKPSVHLAVASP